MTICDFHLTSVQEFVSIKQKRDPFNSFVITPVFCFSPALRRTRLYLGTCQAIGYLTCHIMGMATAVCQGIAWHRETASAACHPPCMTKPLVPHRLTSAAPCVMTPCGSYLSGSKGRPTPGNQGSTAIWPVPKP